MRGMFLLLFSFVFAFFSIGLFVQAKDNGITGSIDDGDVHFSSPDNEYIYTGTIHIKNNSNKDYNNLLLVFDVPEDVGVPYSYEDPIKLDTLKKGKTLEQEVTFKMYGGDIGSKHALTAHLATKNDKDKVSKLVDLKGSTDLSVMKGDYTEMDGTITGQVEQNDEGNYVLDIKVEGINHSIYEIKDEDNIFVAFELPYNLKVDMDNAPKGIFKTLAGGVASGYAVPISAKAGEDFTAEYTLPLTGELSAKQLDDTNTNIYLHTHQPDKINKFKANGIVKGETELDFSAMIKEDKKSTKEEDESTKETDKKDAQKEESEDVSVASSNVDNTQTEEAPFFGVPFFVGLLIGLMLATIIFMLVSRKKNR